MPAHWLNLQVCQNGHITNDDVGCEPERNVRGCECGQSTLIACPKCGAPIHGPWIGVGSMGRTAVTVPPTHCHDCHAPYPWAKRLQAQRRWWAIRRRGAQFVSGLKWLIEMVVKLVRGS